MRNKNILITGSSRGIGLGIAESFARMGANVVLNCNTSGNELEAAVSALKSRAYNAYGIMADVSEYNNCLKVVDFAREKTGEIDVLVNNAAIAHYGLFTDMSPEEVRRITEINQYSVYNCSHAVLPGMIRRKSGCIINISSVWGIEGASCEVIYSASKGAVNAFTKALAKEVAPSGIIVNAIACGVIDTKMNGNLTADDKEALRQSIGLGRFGTPCDVAELAVYMAGTKYMTGQVVTLDGGFS